MTEKIYLSIITPSYNQGEYIERTIRSVLQQEADFPFEYIVIDGGSTDGTRDILTRYNDRLHWISEKDQGQSDAINKGIRMAKGTVVAWLNSDDLYLPGTLQKVRNFFDARPDCQWVYGKCRIVDEQDQEVRKWITGYKNLFLDHYSFNVLLLENFISQPAVFFKKKAFDTVGPLALDLPYAMDFDLWIRLAKQFKPGYIDDYLAGFRVHSEAKSRLNSQQQFLEQYDIHKIHDQRKVLLFLHRLNIYRTISAYRIIEKINRVRMRGSVPTPYPPYK